LNEAKRLNDLNDLNQKLEWDMKDHTMPLSRFPPEQEAVRAKSFHPAGTFEPFPREDLETSIPDRFERMSRRYPKQIAVKAGTQAVTYSELNSTANRIARTILARRGRQAEPIGVLFNNSALMAAAMLGVLKAGKFFVLLDPLIPSARRAFILENSQTELVLTDRESAANTSEIAAGHDQQIVVESLDSNLPSSDLRLEIPATALAYVVFTSGSTGRPKGVLQNHQNLLHRVLVRTNARHLCPEDRIAHLTAGTSNAITNAFLALLNGASLLSFSVRMEGAAALIQWLIREKISFCRIGSPLFRRLSEVFSGKEEFPDLRLIELTSDTIHKSDIELYKSNFSGKTTLVNALSSSETGFLTEYLIDHDTEIAGNDVPVGYLAEDKEIFILDDNGNRAGVDQVGEIVVRSRFLSPGFWREPELTAAKFQVDPQDHRYKLYLTGDLGLLRSDGCLVHKGRKDFRVKVRGYSVEIAEVEQALRGHAEVKDAVVVSRQDEAGEDCLVAYFTARRCPGPTVSDIHGFLRQSLPDYMIPPDLVILDEIPVTGSGKVDRNALPQPRRSRTDVRAQFVAPRTAVERELAQIWQTVLGIDLVGVQDNFLELGGHSLAAARIGARVTRTFGVELPINTVFNSPTVAELSTQIIEKQAKNGEQEGLAELLAEVEGLTQSDARRALEQEQGDK
jgi:amino acid adenylation domain-containing protein